MRSYLEHSAHRVAAGLRGCAAALCWLVAASAHGQEQQALLEVQIDGRNAEQVSSFVVRNGTAYASRAQWRGLGLRTTGTGAAGSDNADADLDGAGLLAATALPGVQARLDMATQTLQLQHAPDLNRLSLVGSTATAPLTVTPSDLGGLVNLDAVAQRGAGGLLTSAFIQARVFGSAGVLEGDFIASNRASTHLRRLNTTFTHSDPQRMRRLRVGDVVSGALAWSRPVRMAGVQAATDFALRPDLVTAPTPQLSGTTAVPSTVDLLVNGVRQLSQPVEAGRFELRQPPVLSGLGDVTVVVRDALGRETLQTLPFYASQRQLASGLSAYSVEVGRVRSGYASSDDQYGAMAAVGTWRHGISDALTLEAHGQATRSTAMAGGGGLINLGAWGLLNGALAVSRSQGQRGGLVSLALERQTPTFSLNLALQRAGRGYRDLAATQGDPSVLHSVRVGIAENLQRFGSIGLAVVDSASAQGRQIASHTRVASLSYSAQVGSGGAGSAAQLFISAYRDLARDRLVNPAGQGSNVGGGSAGRSAGVSMTLVYNFGARSSVATTLARQPSGDAVSVYASQSATAPGELGWRVLADQPTSRQTAARRQAMGEYLSQRGHISLEAEQLAGASATRLSLRSAVLALGGGVHIAPAASDSVALVDVAGLPGVAVYHEHRLVGHTDASGQIVVPGMRSYQRNRLAIDPLDLPMDAQIEQLTQDVNPADRSGLVVRFGLERGRAALVTLRDASGTAPPIGAKATLQGSDQSTTLGHDGQVYLRGLAQRNELRLSFGGAALCVAHFDWASLDAQTGRIGPVSCQ